MTGLRMAQDPQSMSHPHIRVPKSVPEPQRHIWLEYVLAGTIAVMLIAAVMAVRVSPLLFSPQHETVYGSVLETRIDVVNSGSGYYGGYIDYQIKARVRYQLELKEQEQWMPASEISRSRRLLQLQLAESPKLCLVSWAVGHPEHPRCRIELPTRQ
jgi:hypothetical protein